MEATREEPTQSEKAKGFQLRRSGRSGVIKIFINSVRVEHLCSLNQKNDCNNSFYKIISLTETRRI